MGRLLTVITNSGAQLRKDLKYSTRLKMIAMLNLPHVIFNVSAKIVLTVTNQWLP